MESTILVVSVMGNTKVVGTVKVCIFVRMLVTVDRAVVGTVIVCRFVKVDNTVCTDCKVERTVVGRVTV